MLFRFCLRTATEQRNEKMIPEFSSHSLGSFRRARHDRALLFAGFCSESHTTGKASQTKGFPRQQFHGICRNRRTAGVRDRGGRQGFTLLELLIVLALLGIMAGVVAPATGRFLERMNFRRQTSALVAGIRYARLMAVGKGRPVEMRFDRQSGCFLFNGAVEEKKEVDLPEGAVFTFRPETFVFYPDGLATGGEMVSRNGRRSREFLIDPLTGIPVRQ